MEIEPAPERCQTHKLGRAETRDLTQLRKRQAEDLARVTDKLLARIETQLDSPAKIPLGQAVFAFGVLMDKRLLLESGPNTVTTNNTVVINGFSRADAMAFLSGTKAGNGFSPPNPSIPNPAIDLQPTPSVVVNSPIPPKVATKTPS